MSAQATASVGAKIRAIWISMRPRQWTKNLFVLAPLLFSMNLQHAALAAAALAATLLFCLLSGAAYLLNDVRDVDQDKLHARKCRRPVAAGALEPRIALTASIAIDALALAGSFLLSVPLGCTAVAFVALQMSYAFWLKRVVLLDVMTIAAAFVTRVAAGAVAIDVPVSPWLLLCTALLALFLALIKRRQEYLQLEGNGAAHRSTLSHYSLAYLDMMISTVVACVIVAYSLYTFFAHASETKGYMMLTIPFVVYGVFRYLYLVHLKEQGGSPEEVLLSDPPLLITIASWGFVATAILYLT